MKRDKQKRATRRTGPDRTGQDRSEARTSKGAGAGLWAFVEGPHAVSVLLALGLAYRLALIAWLRDTPLWGSIELDHQTYDDWAQRIAGGELTSGHPFFVDPLYAYVLGAVYAVFGHGVLMPRLLQAVMGVATGYAVQQMTVEVGGSRRASVMALALYTFCVPVLFYELQLEKTCLAAALTAWSALVLIRMKRSKTPVRNATLAGVLLGLATLARSTSLVLLVVFAPFAWMQLRTAASSPGGVRPSTAGLLGVVAACLAVCSISFVHNLQAGDGIFLTANVGQNLMLSHDAENTTGTYSVLSFVRPDPRYEEDDFRAEALRRTGATEMSPSSVSAFYRDAALESLAADPARALRMLALRWYRLIQDYDIPDNVNLDVFREYLPTFGIRLPSWGLLLVLGVFGLAWSRRTLPGAGLLLGSVFVSLAAISCFFVVGRFRIPMIPFLCVGAGLGLEAGWALVRDAVPMRRAALAAGAIVLLGFVYYQPEWISAERARSEAVALNNLATSQLDAHHENEALETYARAIRTDSYSVPGALRISTDILLRRGEYARADELMQLLLAGRPEDRRALAMRVRIWEAAAAAGVPGASVELGNAREAAASAAASATDAVAAVDGAPGASATELYARSSALRREGRDREAITALQEAIRVGPYDENGRYLLGTLMEQHATAEEMLAYYQEARATDPKPQTSLYFWAVALERQGHVDEAIAKLGEALEVDPAHEMSEDRLGEIFRARGDLDQAEVHYRRALEIHPEFRTAWQHLGLLLRARHREEEATEADARAAASDPNTPRAQLYWGRYLLAHGRPDAALRELRIAVRRNPGDEEASRLLGEAERAVPAGSAVLLEAAPAGAPADPSGESGGLTALTSIGVDETERGPLLEALGRLPNNTPVWIAYPAASERAAAAGYALGSAFEQAGAVLRGTTALDYSVRPGVYIFAADESYPAYVGEVAQALGAAIPDVSIMSGYRAYSAEQRSASSAWQGVPMSADETYVIVIGRVP